MRKRYVALNESMHPVHGLMRTGDIVPVDELEAPDWQAGKIPDGWELVPEGEVIDKPKRRKPAAETEE